MKKFKLLFVFLIAIFAFCLTNNVFADTNYFATDSWETIISNVKNGNASRYNVGDTKAVDLGNLGTHTLRVANTSTPNSCSNADFSQTACGFVIEFADIITHKRMNPYDSDVEVTTNGTGNKGGWEYSEMRTYVNSTIYNALPADLKAGIIDTKVVSGHGSKDTNNFITTDKLYLLSLTEVRGDINNSDDSAKNLTRQLDYYEPQTIELARKSEYGSWWTRSAGINWDNLFSTVAYGNGWAGYSSEVENGVSPAFRLEKKQESTENSGTTHNNGATDVGSTTAADDDKNSVTISVSNIGKSGIYLTLNTGEKEKQDIGICDQIECDKTTFETNLNKIKLPTPKKDGYKFDGWYLDEEFTKQIKSTDELLVEINKMAPQLSQLVSENRNQDVFRLSFNLYAKWSQVVKTGNTGINQNSLFIIIGSILVAAGSIAIFKKRKN